ncbi:MAG: DUF2279 domain-containing protein [Ignavibacteriae bacterium]|nr:DUF2279 domain-containing protein [Ignavibacteriota bacterium]
MKRLVIILLLITSSWSYAKDSLAVTDGFHLKPEFGGRKIAATASVGGLLVTSLLWSWDSWWRDAGGGFHFISEGWFSGPVRGIDKVGHFYTSYFYFHLFRNIMLWGGYERATADWWAFGGAAFFALSVEVGDGITPQYGFDYKDLVFNLGGIGYAYLQTRIPVLKNFNFKWSFIPEGGYKFPVRFTDDYDAHTYWLACDVNNLLPSSLEPYWPDFLQVALGVGVDDKWSKREFVIGFDINISSIFRTENEDWLLLEKTVNMFHFPAPAVKFTEQKSPRYYLFHRN